MPDALPFPDFLADVLQAVRHGDATLARHWIRDRVWWRLKWAGSDRRRQAPAIREAAAELTAIAAALEAAPATPPALRAVRQE